MDKIIDFPVKCNQCGYEIEEGYIFYKHPELGFVCENCPAFNDGEIKAIKDENE